MTRITVKSKYKSIEICKIVNKISSVLIAFLFRANVGYIRHAYFQSICHCRTSDIEVFYLFVQDLYFSPIIHYSCNKVRKITEISNLLLKNHHSKSFQQA